MGKEFAQKTCRGGGVWGAKLRLSATTGVISKRDGPATAFWLKRWDWSATRI